MKLLFLSDIHGNINLYKRAVEIAKEGNYDLILLGGDLCCSSDLHFVIKEGKKHTYYDVETTFEEKVLDDPKAFCNSMWNQGKPCKIVDEKGVLKIEEKMADADKAIKFYASIQEESIKRLAKVIKQSKTPTYLIPGNDDFVGIEKKLDKLGVNNIHNKTVTFKGITILGFSGINYTPLRTSNFEFSEEELEVKLSALAETVKDKHPQIWLLHAPPFNTNLDEHLFGAHVGSKAIRNCIKAYNPKITLHGHIHESAGFDHLNKTLCLNPGCASWDNILNYVTVELEKELTFTLESEQLNIE